MNDPRFTPREQMGPMMSQQDLQKLEIGMKVIRLMSGVMPMNCIVGFIDDDYIHCGSEDGVIQWEEGWSFSRKTGGEVDEYLGWDGFTTGSYLSKIIE